MKNIGYVSHDQAVRGMIEQLKEKHEGFNFYEIDNTLKVIDKYEITDVVFDFNNFESLEDALLYLQMSEVNEMHFLVIGNEISALLHNEIGYEKVMGHLLKPVNSESLQAAMKYYLHDDQEEMNKEEWNHDKPLLGSRIYSCLLGYYFLNKALQYCRDNQVDQSVRMAVIYDYIANNYHTTKSNVEKSIRKLITSFNDKQNWTNSEYILYFYEQLHLNGMEIHR